MKVDQKALRRRMAQLSTDELTKILEVDFKDYNQEAITAATDELRSRDLPEKTLAYRPERVTSAPEVGTEERQKLEREPSPSSRRSGRPEALSARRLAALVGIGLAGLVVLVLVLMGRRPVPTGVHETSATSSNESISQGQRATAAANNSSIKSDELTGNDITTAVEEAGPETAARARTGPALTLDGCYAARVQVPGPTAIARFAFRKDGTFVEDRPVGGELAAVPGKYRIRGDTIELIYADGDVRRRAFAATKEGEIQIGSVTFLLGGGCGTLEVE